jgi:hypothetical protein
MSKKRGIDSGYSNQGKIGVHRLNKRVFAPALSARESTGNSELWKYKRKEGMPEAFAGLRSSGFFPYSNKTIWILALIICSSTVSLVEATGNFEKYKADESSDKESDSSRAISNKKIPTEISQIQNSEEFTYQLRDIVGSEAKEVLLGVMERISEDEKKVISNFVSRISKVNAVATDKNQPKKQEPSRRKLSNIKQKKPKPQYNIAKFLIGSDAKYLKYVPNIVHLRTLSEGNVKAYLIMDDASIKMTKNHFFEYQGKVLTYYDFIQNSVTILTPTELLDNFEKAAIAASDREAAKDAREVYKLLLREVDGKPFFPPAAIADFCKMIFTFNGNEPIINQNNFNIYLDADLMLSEKSEGILDSTDFSRMPLALTVSLMTLNLDLDEQIGFIESIREFLQTDVDILISEIMVFKNNKFLREIYDEYVAKIIKDKDNNRFIECMVGGEILPIAKSMKIVETLEYVEHEEVLEEYLKEHRKSESQTNDPNILSFDFGEESQNGHSENGSEEDSILRQDAEFRFSKSGAWKSVGNALYKYKRKLTDFFSVVSKITGEKKELMRYELTESLFSYSFTEPTPDIDLHVRNYYHLKGIKKSDEEIKEEVKKYQPLSYSQNFDKKEDSPYNTGLLSVDPAIFGITARHESRSWYSSLEKDLKELIRIDNCETIEDLTLPHRRIIEDHFKKKSVENGKEYKLFFGRDVKQKAEDIGIGKKIKDRSFQFMIIVDGKATLYNENAEETHEVSEVMKLKEKPKTNPKVSEATAAVRNHNEKDL